MRRHAAGPPYALLSVLLRYPDERLLAAREELAAAVAELPRSPAKRPLERFTPYLLDTPPPELAQRYVATFDLQWRSSLYLGYYLHGDTRKRGVALLRLRHLYAGAGLEQTNGELPDYLPLVLEFAAHAPAGAGETVLREHRPSLELLRSSLEADASPYAHVLEAVCCGLPRLTPLERARIRGLATDGPPGERVGLEPFAPPDVMPAETRA